jgi:hypothetical protein
MIVKFYDRQDLQNAVNGTDFADSKQVMALIESLRERPRFFCELLGESGYNLLVGIGGEVGCTQYSREDGSPPYWMAMSSATTTKEGYVDFLMADTATPVPLRYCLPFDAVKDIIVYFQDTGLRSPDVNWEEI